MISVSHIATRLSSVAPGPSILPALVVNNCIYCGCLLDDPNAGTLVQPLTCPVDMVHTSHHWRACRECTNIASSIYYYAGHGNTFFPKPKIKGAQLDVYVWILRENPQDCWTRVQNPMLARELHYSYATIAGALTRLRARGLVEKRRTGRYCDYRPLIWQRPKGE